METRGLMTLKNYKNASKNQVWKKGLFTNSPFFIVGILAYLFTKV